MSAYFFHESVFSAGKIPNIQSEGLLAAREARRVQCLEVHSGGRPVLFTEDRSQTGLALTLGALLKAAEASQQTGFAHFAGPADGDVHDGRKRSAVELLRRPGMTMDTHRLT